jgi:hypothetical protein
MMLNLPKPVAAYFTADEVSGEALSRCFTDDAVVKDEGHTYNGRAAIKGWKKEASAKYQYTANTSSRAGLPGTFLAARSIFGSSSNLNATKSCRWKLFRDQGIAARHIECID